VQTSSASPGVNRTLDLPLHPSSAGAARRFVAAQLSEADLSEISDTAELLMSELVTNSLLHARTPMRVEVSLSNSLVRIAVHDECTVLGSRRPFAEDATTGRGYVLLDSLAHEWGTERTVWGKVTWCTLAVAPPAVAADH
jgi:anti-sigma regulatory factor (Ser/Thr protein kinase)